MRSFVAILIVSLLCGPYSSHSHGGPFKKWKAARQARHTPASATPYCGPGGCDPATLSIPPGFQPLTPLASQQQVTVQTPQAMVAVQPAAPATSVDVQVPMSQAVAAPVPPDTPDVVPQSSAVATTTESQDARAARLIDALAAKFGVEDEVDPPPARKLLDDLPTVVVSVEYPDHTDTVKLDATQWARAQLGAE